MKLDEEVLDIDYNVAEENASNLAKLPAIYVLQPNATTLSATRKGGELAHTLDDANTSKSMRVIIIKSNDFLEVTLKAGVGKDNKGKESILVDARYVPNKFDKELGYYATSLGHKTNNVKYVYCLAEFKEGWLPAFIKIRAGDKGINFKTFSEFLTLRNADFSGREQIKVITELSTKLINAVDNRYGYSFKDLEMTKDNKILSKLKPILPSADYDPFNFVEKETREYLSEMENDLKVLVGNQPTLLN